MEERQIQTERGTVHYWISQKPNTDMTLVFLHGLTADHTLFEKQVWYFAAKCSVIAWDAPAHGKSRPYDGFTYPDAAEVLKTILDENHVDSAVLIGQSMGGYVIQSFLQRYPHRAKAFIGIDTCPYGDYYSASDKWWLRQIEWMCRLYPVHTLKKSMARQCAKTEYAYRNMLAALSPYDKTELCHLLGIGFAGFLEDNREMTISCPVLLLVGESDRTGKVRKYCDEWAKRTGYPLHIIKNAAHNSNADNPDEVNALMEAFLRDHAMRQETGELK